MITPEILSFLGIALSSVCTIMVALIQKASNERKKVDDAREERRQKEMRLSMEMMSAAVELGVINAIALQHGTLNGNVEQAKAKAEESLVKYRSFLADVASEVV